MGIERLAPRPVQAAARSGRLALASELDRAVDQVVERLLADERVGRAAATVADRVVTSPAFAQALGRALESAEIRRAARRQAAGFGAELAQALRAACARRDDAVEKQAHRIVRRPFAPARFGGVVSRAVALGVDGGVVLLAFLAGVAFLWVVGALAGRPGRLVEAIGTAVLWSAVVAAYFVGFWSTVGQTPGLRLLGLRVLTPAGRPPSAPRSLVRLAVLLLSIAFCFVGFLPALVDRQRRALHDLVAGTTVERPAPSITRSG